MNCAFVCFSKYQLMNSINIIKSFNEFKTYNNDLFISSSMFIDNDINIKLLCDNKIFDNVFIYNDCNYSNLIKKVFIRILEIINPHLCIKHMLNNKSEYSLIKKKYDKLFISYQQGISIPLSFITNKNNINYYDDGMASYYDDRQQHKLIRRLIYMLLFHSLNKIKPTNLYVYERKIVTKNIKKIYKKIIEIPKIKEKEMIDFLSQVFGIEYNIKKYSEKIIFLTQPNDDKLKSNDEMNLKIFSLLNNFKTSVLIRKHPRIVSEFIDFKIDNNKKLWELSIIHSNMENIVLIGNSSTAQITPKLVFDLEPMIVFTFKLYHNMYSKKVTLRLIDLLNNIKNCYSDKTKVIIVDSLEELENIIRNQLKNG